MVNIKQNILKTYTDTSIIPFLLSLDVEDSDNGDMNEFCDRLNGSSNTSSGLFKEDTK